MAPTSARAHRLFLCISGCGKGFQAFHLFQAHKMTLCCREGNRYAEPCSAPLCKGARVPLRQLALKSDPPFLHPLPALPPSLQCPEENAHLGGHNYLFEKVTSPVEPHLLMVREKLLH